MLAIDEDRIYVCRDCGGDMIGDGYYMPLHCEYVDCPEDREPDAPPLFCGGDEEEADYQ